VKPVIAVVGLVGVVVAVLRRRQTQADQALWREATSDSSR
jgi:cytochrome c-type biogenesis protein CcmH/NrfF